MSDDDDVIREYQARVLSQTLMNTMTPGDAVCFLLFTIVQVMAHSGPLDEGERAPIVDGVIKSASEYISGARRIMVRGCESCRAGEHH